jgi:hypothetical protein
VVLVGLRPAVSGWAGSTRCWRWAIIVVRFALEGRAIQDDSAPTEQHDLGKLAFAFVMLNIYLAFSQFLIIWSGNLPEEIPWYLDRIRGGWGAIITLDFISVG